MLLIKNAMRNISRAKGRSLLIGIIITIVALSICVGLCIRQSAEDAKKSALSDLTITATIDVDREAAMKEASSSGKMDKSTMRKSMGSALTLKQLKKYAKADSVQSFYYTLRASLDASGSLEAYSSSSSSSSGQSSQGMPRDGPQESQGDFVITGYSSDEAMTDFVSGTSKITSGTMFKEGTSDKVCVISSELAKYNNLKVGDTITLANPNKSSEKYKLKIVGIYTNSQSSAQASMGGPGMRTDPANNIYTSYNTLQSIVSTSTAKYSKSSTTAIRGQLNGTYVLGTVAKYESFQKEVKTLGLSSKYTVSSQDIQQVERSTEPLENLADFAKYFLVVILVVGAVILVVMNIFSTRERKYEIGVLTAIGMKKKDVAKLFMTEIMIIALVGVIIGGTIGSLTSVPITKTLLSSQITSEQNHRGDMQQAFGRDNNGGGPPAEGQGPGSQATDSSDSTTSSDSASSAADSSKDSTQAQAQPQGPGQQAAQYMTDISNSVNLVVLLELLVMCIALALIAGMVSVVSIMRYEPLQILSNRD